jgi:hypothetical protein
LYTNSATVNTPIAEEAKEIPRIAPYSGLTTDFYSLLYDNLAEATYNERGFRLGIKFNNSIQLWYLLRMLDKKGSGWAEIDLDRAGATLGRGKGTIKRYIKQGLAKGFFRAAVRIAPERWRIYYASLFKVAAIAGLDNWGATVEITEADLPRLKLLATEMTAKSLQASSRHLAGKKHDRVPTVPQLLNSSLCCRGVKGKKIRRSKRFISVTADLPTFGASQSKTASLLGRHWQTVCRRLSNEARAKRGLPPIARRQILKESEEALIAIRGKRPRTNKAKVFLGGRDRAFISRPNVYAFDMAESEINLTRKERKALKKQAAIASSESLPDRHLKSKKLARYFYRRQRSLLDGPHQDSL